ncbi:uncharacterized protein BT62DRAFT_249469 [Guyanagaster necrorhizus]|uniref:Uncharacterized protein n=1 Tax=Guyanagaster necrorhizus TaxID=856835 RepID=A0A9P7VP63_9AGAR|nr:uncharacterized protein BT62DRAFT_249469 [Guyanagaster necrorhizus MCA 3950]KAG7444057.1 hypothetical protein BT62DRAFT_249469 [Guyanagaster necrorhizus MCA 3950]
MAYALTVIFESGYRSACSCNRSTTERMASSDKTEQPTAADSPDENKSETPVVDNAAAAASNDNTSEEKSQPGTGSGTLNEASTPGGEAAGCNAGQQLAADSDSEEEEEEEEWDMSRMGFRGPIGIPMTGGGGLKRPMQKPRPKPST